MENKINIFKSKDGIEIHVKLEQDTVWLSQAQLAALFKRNVRTISEHISNIYRSKELSTYSTIRNFQTVRKEGIREVNRNIEHYNLDLIIAVGFRVKSKQGTQFRIWANRVLKDSLVKGYSINEKHLAQNEFDEQILKEGIQTLDSIAKKKKTNNA